MIAPSLLKICPSDPKDKFWRPEGSSTSNSPAIRIITHLQNRIITGPINLSFGSERQNSRPHKPQKSSTYHLIKIQLFNWCGPKRAWKFVSRIRETYFAYKKPHEYYRTRYKGDDYSLKCVASRVQIYVFRIRETICPTLLATYIVLHLQHLQANLRSRKFKTSNSPLL